MSTVTPPPPPVPSAPASVSGLANTTALVLGAPAQTLQALQALQAGQSLQAVMAAMPAANQIQVQTTLGILTLQTSLSIPRGAVLTLAVNPSGTPAQSASSQGAPQGANLQNAAPSFTITAINGKPVAGGQSATQGAAQTSPQSATPPLSPGQSVTLTLVRPALGVATQSAGPSAGPSAPTGQAATQATPQTATQGTSQAASQAATGAARATPASSTQAPTTTQATQAQTATTQTTTPTTTAPGTTTPGTTTLATGTRFSATVQRIDAPGASVTTAASASGAAGKALASGQVLSGVVTGRAVGGQAIVQTPGATFALGNAAALGEGAKLTFRLDSAPLPPAPSSPATAALRGPGAAHQLIAAKTWDDLGEALKTLVASDPARLTQVAQTALPQPGAKLTSQMLFFLSALKGGDLKGLFGDTALRLIDKERPGLLTRMGGDFQTMARLADEPQSGDWRLALIPLWTGDKLEQLRFFWRGGGGGEDGGESEEETRFVLDLDLSNLGHLQIDGLVKGKRNHLDLIVRSDQPLPAEMRTDIADIFETARETLGLGGQIAFQAAPGNFIAVPDAAPNMNANPAPHATGLLA